MPEADTKEELDSVADLGDVIAEGESRKGGYNAYNSGNKGTGGRVLHSGVKDLAKMTVDQILESSKLSGRDSNRVFAAGKYQIITETLKLAKAEMPLSGGENFTPELQEKIFLHYLLGKKRSKIGAYITRGIGTSEDATYQASMEWASIEVPKGRPISKKSGGTISNGRLSYYEGLANHAHAGSGAKTKAALEHARATFDGSKNSEQPTTKPEPIATTIGDGTTNTESKPETETENQTDTKPETSDTDAKQPTTEDGGGTVTVTVTELTPIVPGHIIATSVGRGGRNHHHDVGTVQKALAAKGHSPGAIDHRIGPKTIAAITAFQRGFLAKPDGLVEVGRATETHLIEGSASKNETEAESTQQKPSEATTEQKPEATSDQTPEQRNEEQHATTDTDNNDTDQKTEPELTKNASLRELLAQSRLTSAQIAQARKLIAAEPKAERAPLYRRLQTKVLYANQRDNKAKLDGRQIETGHGEMCNLTSLAMCLQYLGIPNPHPEMQYEDALERVRQERGFKARTDPDGWGAVARALGANVAMLSWGGARDRAWWTRSVGAALAAGQSVMCSISGHIVRVQSVEAGGLVVDDPYGKRALLPGGEKRWKHIENNSAANPDAGEDVTWTWDQVEPHLFRWVAAFGR